jgi:hypothetical protein
MVSKYEKTTRRHRMCLGKTREKWTKKKVGHQTEQKGYIRIQASFDNIQE